MIVERLITVEYLDPSMSQELLGKFPDATAFDFDYSQSGIWSPLLPRGKHSSSSVFPIESQKKFLDVSRMLSPGILRTVKGKIIRKHKKQTVAPKRLELSSSPTPKKVIFHPNLINNSLYVIEDFVKICLLYRSSFLPTFQFPRHF